MKIHKLFIGYTFKLKFHINVIISIISIFLEYYLPAQSSKYSSIISFVSGIFIDLTDKSRACVIR